MSSEAVALDRDALEAAVAALQRMYRGGAEDEPFNAMASTAVRAYLGALSRPALSAGAVPGVRELAGVIERFDKYLREAMRMYDDPASDHSVWTDLSVTWRKIKDTLTAPVAEGEPVAEDEITVVARAMADNQLWYGAFDSMGHERWAGATAERELWLSHAKAALIALANYRSAHMTYEQARAARPLAPTSIGDGVVVPRGLDTETQVFFYEQDFYVLSNFSAFNLLWEGTTFPTSEHAYHWMKFIAMPGGQQAARLILEAPSAHMAFKLAEEYRVNRRPDWDVVKVNIMRAILREKVGQHEYVRRKLLATGDRELVENSWRDDFWGWGPNRDGQNMLGKLWMEVRAELLAAAPGASDGN